MKENNFCPGCRRHCSLQNPECERGEEYARTGNPAQNEIHGKHTHRTRRPHDHAESINDKLVLNFRDISHMMRRQYEGKASQKRILIILN